MTDARRRELERAGDLEAQARALVEAVRAGELAQADLHLAADLGVEPAGLASGRAPRPIEEVCEGVQRQAGPRLIRAACALADLLLPAWTWPRPPEMQGGEWVRDAVGALRAARDHGAAIGTWEVANAFMAATEEDRLLSTRKALAAHAVGLAVAAAEPLGTRRGRSWLAPAGRLAQGLIGAGHTHHALAVALLPPRLRPTPPSSPPGWCSEADHLRGRLAAGDPRDRVELAARLGHEAAAEALGVEPGAASSEAWLERLDRDSPFTQEACVRVILAAAQETVITDSFSGRVGHALKLAAAWCRARDDAPLETLIVARQELTGHVSELARLALDACAGRPAVAVDRLAEARALSEAHAFSSALFRYVVPWLLGYRDALVVSP